MILKMSPGMSPKPENLSCPCLLYLSVEYECPTVLWNRMALRVVPEDVLDWRSLESSSYWTALLLRLKLYSHFFISRPRHISFAFHLLSYTTTTMATTSTLKDQAIQLKEEGNILFSLKKYDEAMEKFTKAIGLDGQNAVFSANHAASYWALQRFRWTAFHCPLPQPTFF